MSEIKVLNLYAGLGGNRKLWTNCKVTAVENYEPVAKVYKKLYPEDNLIIGDAHDYLLNNYEEYDFIWTSPPCPTHSKMMVATKHKKKWYPDMALYQQVIFLNTFFKGGYVVENVTPYYEPLISGKKMGRHLMWSNFHFPYLDIKKPKGLMKYGGLKGMKELQKWLGIHFDEIIYYKNNHCPAQILRNCVHPKLGKHILDYYLSTLNIKTETIIQKQLF